MRTPFSGLERHSARDPLAHGAGPGQRGAVHWRAWTTEREEEKSAGGRSQISRGNNNIEKFQIQTRPMFPCSGDSSFHGTMLVRFGFG